MYKFGRQLVEINLIIQKRNMDFIAYIIILNEHLKNVNLLAFYCNFSLKILK